MKAASSVEDFTYASNEGNIKINPKKYLGAFKVRWPKSLYYGYLLGKGEEYIVAKHSNEILLRNYFELGRLMSTGDAIPTTIINVEQGIIATYTNLSAVKELSVPVIQLTRTDLSKLTGMELKVGMRLVSVATYLRHEGDFTGNQWKSYKSILPYPYSANWGEIEKAFNGIPDAKWKEFTYGLSCIPDKSKLGMYKIHLSGMKDAKP